MELPRRMPQSKKYRLILGEFYDLNKSKQWFIRAEIDEKHPTRLKETLTLYVNYNPVLEMKEILAFCHKNNLCFEIETESNKD